METNSKLYNVSNMSIVIHRVFFHIISCVIGAILLMPLIWKPLFEIWLDIVEIKPVKRGQFWKHYYVHPYEKEVFALVSMTVCIIVQILWLPLAMLAAMLLMQDLCGAFRHLGEEHLLQRTSATFHVSCISLGFVVNFLSLILNL